MKINPVLMAFVVVCLLAPIFYLFSSRPSKSEAVTEEMLWI